MPHGFAYHYVVRVGDDEYAFWRFLRSDAMDASHFLSRHEAGKRPRLWPEAREDYLLYRGISVWSNRDLAIAKAQEVNADFLEQGRPRRWTHVARFVVNGHEGHLYAEEGPEGHYSVWGRQRTSPQVQANPFRFLQSLSRIQGAVTVTLPAVSFLILDMDSGNAVSFFETEIEAQSALQRIVRVRPEDEWMDLVLIGSDKLGRTVTRTLASSIGEQIHGQAASMRETVIDVTAQEVKRQGTLRDRLRRSAGAIRR